VRGARHTDQQSRYPLADQTNSVSTSIVIVDAGT